MDIKNLKLSFLITVLDILNFDKDTALIIGDSLTSDMQGGIDAQIDTCWYNPQHDKASIKIDYIIHDLKELENML